MTRFGAASLLALSLFGQAPDRTPEGFAVARPGHRFTFPADHGAHPTFRTEWWYITGHLWAADGRRFGYQLTFFRQAGRGGAFRGSAAWRSDQIHLAHAALTDLAADSFASAERLNREGVLAGAAEGRLDVFHGAWHLTQRGDGTLSLALAVKDAKLELALRPLTAPVVFGEDGVSRKGEDPTAASHYVTFPRLAATGTLSRPSGPVAVAGQGWMDHEWSSNQLDADQVGWDWVAVQFRDGRSLMAYRLRKADGRQDRWSTVTELDAAGTLLRTTRTFTLTGSGHWRSPASGATYPQPLELAAWGRRWRLQPLRKDQELRSPRATGITYWEGACRVLDEEGREVGAAYLEQTGYAHTLKGRF